MQRNSFLFACITSAASTLLTENSSSLCKKKTKQKNNQKYNGFDLVICVTYANIIYLKNTLVDRRVRKYAKFGVFYAKIVQMTPLRLRRE